MSLLSLAVLPLYFWTSTFSPIPRHFVKHLVLFIMTGVLDKYTLFRAASVVDSPSSLAQLATVRGALVLALLVAPRLAPSILLVVMVGGAVSGGLLYAIHRSSVTELATGSDLDEVYDRLKVLQLPSTTKRCLAAIAVLPLLLSALYHQLPLPAKRHIAVQSSAETVDVVISTFNEPAENIRAHVDKLKSYWWVGGNEPRVILYLKGNISHADPEAYRKAAGADLAIMLENKGREAGTFLTHIVNNYNASLRNTGYRAGFADHTLFMQHHLAWDWIARERMWLFKRNTGYLHFAPYVKLDCGKDMDGNGDFPRIAQVYSMFREEVSHRPSRLSGAKICYARQLCPPTLQLGAYSAQFVVSRERIRR